MMEWIGPTAVIGLLSVGGLYLGHLFTRRNDKDTLLLSSRDEHVRALREDLSDTRERLDKLAATVDEQGDQIRSLQAREWTLKRYVITLLDQIKALGGDPKEPPRGIDLYP